MLTCIIRYHDGFIFVERFQGLRGRETVFENYRLRVANVIRDYGMFDRDEAPEDSQDVHNMIKD